MRFALVSILLCCTGLAQAQTVALSGSLGTSKALLMVNGKARTVAVGSVVDGVRLIKVDAGEALVEVAGRQELLRLGASQINLSGEPIAQGGNRLVLNVSQGGHFMSAGTINGKTVSFLVDTGATAVSISQSDAERIGLKYLEGRKVLGNTANGQVTMHQITLDSVRVGELQVFNVSAVVIPAEMPYVLLGNSFLGRFQMRRESDQMTLERRY
jgi:aspartyl protease family protein